MFAIGIQAEAIWPDKSTTAASSKRQQQHPGLILTGIYNVLERPRRIDSVGGQTRLRGRIQQEGIPQENARETAIGNSGRNLRPYPPLMLASNAEGDAIPPLGDAATSPQKAMAEGEGVVDSRPGAIAPPQGATTPQQGAVSATARGSGRTARSHRASTR